MLFTFKSQGFFLLKQRLLVYQQAIFLCFAFLLMPIKNIKLYFRFSCGLHHIKFHFLSCPFGFFTYSVNTGLYTRSQISLVAKQCSPWFCASRIMKNRQAKIPLDIASISCDINLQLFILRQKSVFS